MFLAADCLIFYLYVGPYDTILRFILKSAKVGNPLFIDESIPTLTGVLRHPFNRHNRGPAGRRDVERNDRHVGRAAFGGRPLHPAETE